MIRYILLFSFIINQSFSLSLERIVEYFEIPTNIKGSIDCKIINSENQYFSYILSDLCSIRKDQTAKNTLVLVFERESPTHISYIYKVYLRVELIDGVYSIKVINQTRKLFLDYSTDEFTDYLVEGKSLLHLNYLDSFYLSIPLNPKYTNDMKLSYESFTFKDSQKLKTSGTLKSIYEKEEPDIKYSELYDIKFFLKSIKLLFEKKNSVNNLTEINNMYSYLMGKIYYCVYNGCLNNSLLIYEQILKHYNSKPLIIKINPIYGEHLHGPDGFEWNYHVTLVYYVKSSNDYYVLDQDTSLSDKIPTLEDFLKKLNPELNGSIEVISYNPQ